METFEERSTRVYRQKQMFSKEELAARERLCVHDEPAFCAAACPLKLDARALAAALRAGDFTAARALVEAVAPFPLILAHGCEAPCAGACRLNETGGRGVDIGALERAAMAHGAPKTGRGLLKFKKKKTAAVFGADLFTLALAGELARKSYPVTFFCAEPDGAALLSACAPFLDGSARAEEAKRLAAADIDLRYGAALSPALFAAERGHFDLLCASRDFARRLDPGAQADEETLVCPGTGVISRPAAARGVLAALFDAKRAAVTADRLAQGMDPAASRGQEGAVQSRLYTDLSAVRPSKRVPEPPGGYGRDEARVEAGRCIDCRCEECLKACAYLRHYKIYPRLLTREIYNNVSIIMGDHIFNKPINSCALCGQCAVVCPNGYDMAEICRMARQNMVATDKMPLAAHEFALCDLLFSNTEAFLARPQPGFETCRYVFFPGCQAGAAAPETVRRAYADLCARLPGGVALILGCCGAIAQWAGRDALFDDTRKLLQSTLAKLGGPRIIAGCPTCRRTLSGALDTEVIGVWDVLNDIGLPAGAAAAPRAMAMHDACGARGEPETQQAVRRLAEKLGCRIEETPYSGDKTLCCGYGGLVAYANPEVAREMAAQCVSESDAPFLTYCMACRDRLAREGHPSAHILELVYGPPAGAPPDISEKRRNRLKLKNDLLKDLWGVDVMEKARTFPLDITEEARAQMDARMILDTDILAVLEDYRENGEAVLDTETGLLTARKRIGNVTFWVKFLERDGGCVVRGAYSHRMTVE